jgi:AcrR family transcriptional regulator
MAELVGVERLAAVDEAVPPARPMRADAVKNRERILAAAEGTFAGDGVNVPIDVIAERAGVGTGTLYRHFPTKEALYEAVVMVHLAKLLETAQGYAASDDPGAALFSFLGEFATQMVAKRDLIEALNDAGIDFKSNFESQCGALLEEFKVRVGALLVRAQSVGAVRRDTSVEEVLGLIGGVCHSGAQAGIDADGMQRMVGVILDGLRTD